MSTSSTGFFTPPTDFIEDLTLIPGEKHLLKTKKTSKTEHNCDTCGLCAHSKIKVKDEELSVEEEQDTFGKVIVEEDIKYKYVPQEGDEKIPVFGKGNKNIMIVCDVATENKVSAGKPLIGQEMKLLKKMLRDVNLNLEEDCYLINSVRGWRPRPDNKHMNGARKSCSHMLKAEINRLKPNVIVTLGFSALSVLYSHKVSIKNDHEIYEMYTIPDQEYKAHVIHTFGLNDYLYLLNNKKENYKKWIRDKERKEETVPIYYFDAISDEVPLCENTLLMNDEYKIKYRRTISSLQSAVDNYNVPVEIDDYMSKIKILENKHDIINALGYFNTVKCVSVDIEATTLSFTDRPEAKILCIGISDGKQNVSYMMEDPDVLRMTKDLIDSDKVMKVAHNAQYEYKAFKRRLNADMSNLYLDTQVLQHGYDHRGGASGLKHATLVWKGIVGYDNDAKPFFNCSEIDQGTSYEKSEQAINKMAEGLERAELYEKGLLFPLDGTSKKVKDENKRREKELKKGVLTREQVLTYVALDAYFTTELVKIIPKRLLNKREFDAIKFVSEGGIALAKMSLNGVQTNQDQLQKNLKELDVELAEAHAEIVSGEEVKKWDGGKDGKTPFNYNSGAQLGRLLFEILEYPGGVKTKTGYKTDKATLEKIESPLCKAILRKKSMAKGRDTYLATWSREVDTSGIAYPSFPTSLTLSWRSSCFSPNMHNSPKHNPRLKKMTRNFVVPHKGQELWEFDFSAAENYMNSILSGDKELLRFNTDSSTDLHRSSAMDIFLIDDYEALPSYTVGGNEIVPPDDMFGKLRQIAKTFNFAEMYGGSYVNISTDLWESLIELPKEHMEWIGVHLERKGVRNKSDFIEIVKQAEYIMWNVRFKDYGAWKKATWNTYVKQGYLQSHVGHVYRSVLNKRTCSNYDGQGSSWEKLLCGLIEAQNKFDELGLKSKIICEVHDSAIVSVEKSEEFIVEQIMTEALLEATKRHPLFKFINIDFVLDCDKYVDGNWSTKPIEKRMDITQYTSSYFS